ncbi:MAG: hypothetical protein AAF399_16600 [Bacteroidota bacterium]
MASWTTEVTESAQKGDIKKALKLFVQNNQDSYIEETLILLTARWNMLRDSEISGVISNSNANIEKMRIVQSLLGLLEDVEIPTDSTNQDATNQTIINGDGNIVIQGVSGSEIHIHQ